MLGQPLQDAGASGNPDPTPHTTPPALGMRGYVRLIRLNPGFYCLHLLRPAGPRATSTTALELPLVHIGSVEFTRQLEMRDSRGRPTPWLGAAGRHLFVTMPENAVPLLVTTYDEGDNDEACELEIRRLDLAENSVVIALHESAVNGPPVNATVQARGVGEVRFARTVWVGRLGRGVSLEAFTLTVAEAYRGVDIEYRALAASGRETAWTAGGSRCGENIGEPLVSFAVRQRMVPGSKFYDCIYSGYFQSGAIVGPMRNGAPCRSPVADDPLEGLQIQIAERPPRPAR